MTSRIVVNNIEADSGVSTVTFGSEISASRVTTSSGQFTVGTGASVYSPATNVLSLGTNNTEKVRIDSSGNFNLVNTAGIMTAFKYETPALINNHFKSQSTTAGAYVRMYAAASSGQWDIYGNGANLRFSDNASSGNIQMDRPLSMNSQNIIMSSGYGIDFSAASNAAGMTSELLDDYEKGTWTPAFVNGTSVNYSPTYTDGWYIKIGDFVLAGGVITTYNFSNTATQMQITLPFTVGNNNREYGPVNLFPEFGNIYSPGEIMALVVPGTNRMQLYKMASSSTANYSLFEYDDVEDVDYRIRWTAVYGTD